MDLTFSNRIRELRELDRLKKRQGLVVIMGRRRVGKTRLLKEWIARSGGCYSQAIEAQTAVQISQIHEDIKSALNLPGEPRSWEELFDRIDLSRKKFILCLDEFPYLAVSDPSLPSRLQKWLDHSKKKGKLIVVSGSSTSLMYRDVLSARAPLYGRAVKILLIQPMKYLDFVKCLKLDPSAVDSFLLFSIVGGFPKYWELIDAAKTVIENAEELYFDPSSYFEGEPSRLLSDEKANSLYPLSVLEAIGRGAEKPSEIAGRLEIPQTTLSKTFEQLIHASILKRDTPFGSSVRSPKKVLYRLGDPTLRFWFRVCSPHRSRWFSYPEEQKMELIRWHASSVFEDYWRESHSGGQRFWEKGAEFDLVYRLDGKGKKIGVAEVKFQSLNEKERAKLLDDLKSRWEKSSISRKFSAGEFSILDWNAFVKHASSR